MPDPEQTPTVSGFAVSYESSEDTPEVDTQAATDVTHNSAQLNAELTDLGEETEVDGFFRYRETGESEWNTTDPQTLSATGEFDDEVAGLSDETEHEFKAVVQWENGEEENTGDVLTFTTTEAADEPSAEIKDYKGPLTGSEFESENIRFEFDVEFLEPGDYYVDIMVDGVREFRDEVNGATAEQINNYDETLNVGLRTNIETEALVQKQSDGD